MRHEGVPVLCLWEVVTLPAPLCWLPCCPAVTMLCCGAWIFNPSSGTRRVLWLGLCSSPLTAAAVGRCCRLGVQVLLLSAGNMAACPSVRAPALRAYPYLQLQRRAFSTQCPTHRRPWRALKAMKSTQGHEEAPVAVLEPPKPASVGSAALSEFKPERWVWEESNDALKTYGIFLGILGLGALPQAAAWDNASLFYFISLAVATIYIGAHRGLNAKQRQQITLKEGVLAPIAASVALVIGYLLVKFLPDLSIQSLLDGYFWLLGSVAVVGAFAAPAKTLGKRLGLPTWQLDLPGWLVVENDDGERETKGELSLTDLLVVALAVGVASADVTAHHTNFTLNNMVACLIATDILQLVGLSSFRVAAVLLCGLLAYDVFWVFGSPSVIGENVMMTVATSDVLTGPVRLLFPRIPGSVGEASFFPFSLLGLGDVAVPGLLACLALRYDASRAIDMRARGQAAAQAIQEAIASLDADMTNDEIAEATGSAAEAAYDRIADMELEQRNRTMGAIIYLGQ